MLLLRRADNNEIIESIDCDLSDEWVWMHEIDYYQQTHGIVCNIDETPSVAIVPMYVHNRMMHRSHLINALLRIAAWTKIGSRYGFTELDRQSLLIGYIDLGHALGKLSIDEWANLLDLVEY